MPRQSQVIKRGYGGWSRPCPLTLDFINTPKSTVTMLAGRLCFSQCELVILPPGLHNRLFSIHSMAIVTVSHGIGGKGMAEGSRERRLDIIFPFASRTAH